MRFTSGARSRTRVSTSFSVLVYISDSCGGRDTAAVYGALHEIIETAHLVVQGGPTLHGGGKLAELPGRCCRGRCFHDRRKAADGCAHRGVLRDRAEEIERDVQVLAGDLTHVAFDRAGGRAIVGAVHHEAEALAAVRVAHTLHCRVA